MSERYFVRTNLDLKILEQDIGVFLGIVENANLSGDFPESKLYYNVSYDDLIQFMEDSKYKENFSTFSRDLFNKNDDISVSIDPMSYILLEYWPNPSSKLLEYLVVESKIAVVDLKEKMLI